MARRAIIAGVDNETVQALKNFLQSVNCQVELGLDEKDVVKVAQKTKPDAIFCQVWEDLRVLDAVALSGQLSANAATQKIPYVAFCISALSSEAGKNLPGRKIIVYTDMLDLLKKTYAFFQQLDQVPA